MITSSAPTDCRTGSGFDTVLDTVILWATGLSRTRAWTITATAVLAAVLASRAAGPDVWFGPVYLLIVCLPAWSLGRLPGLGVGLACASLNLMANGMSIYPLGELAIFWNLSMRVLSVAIIVMLVDGLRRSYDREWMRARSDELTGALTREAFAEATAMARRRPHWGLLAYVDLDGFKQINDSLGHAAGDDVLRAFAAAVRSSIRAGDVFARIGGDEFLVYLALRDGKDAASLALHLHSRLNGIIEGLPYPIACSIGAVILDPRSAAVTEAEIALADRAMYEAKRSGSGMVIGEAPNPQVRDHGAIAQPAVACS